MAGKESVLGKTIGYMETVSKFSFFDGLEYKLTQRSRFKTYDEIERELLIGKDIAASDFFIIKIIADFSFCNVEMIQLAITKMKSSMKNQELIVPSAEKDSVKRAITQLCRYGLIREFSYETADKQHTIMIFCVTESGLEVIRKKFYYNTAHTEPMTSLNLPEEAFRRTASNYIGQKLAFHPLVTKYIPGKNEYVRGLGKQFIYSRLFFKDGSGKKYHLIVEPLYFKHDRKMNTEEKITELVKNRLKIITRLLENFEESHENLVIFVIEDKIGLKKAIQLVIEYFPYFVDRMSKTLQVSGKKNIDQENAPFLDQMYFTSENAVYNNTTFEDALVQIKSVKEDGQINIREASRLI